MEIRTCKYVNKSDLFEGLSEEYCNEADNSLENGEVTYGDAPVTLCTREYFMDQIDDDDSKDADTLFMRLMGLPDDCFINLEA